MVFDYYAIGDAAVALGIPHPTLRHYCDMGKIVAKRASDGSRLFAPDEIQRAKKWLKKNAEEKALARREIEKHRQAKARAKEQIRAKAKARRAKPAA